MALACVNAINNIIIINTMKIFYAFRLVKWVPYSLYRGGRNDVHLLKICNYLYIRRQKVLDPIVSLI